MRRGRTSSRGSYDGLRVLVTDGSSLSARQVVTAAGQMGAVVDILATTSRSLGRFSRYVNRSHAVPRLGSDPRAWMDAALDVLRLGQHDVLLAVHEHTAVVSRAADEVRACGVRLAVPEFAALRQLQHKVTALDALRAAGLAHPPTDIAADGRELMTMRAALPAYVKAPIGTASTSVFRAVDQKSLNVATARMRSVGAFALGGALVQRAVDGPLLMAQAVFDRGELIAHHATIRTHEGANGSSSHKRGVAIAALEHDVSALGRSLRWHGALSVDAILTGDGLRYIDVNPRLVEPGNAQLAGVDLVGRLLDVALERPIDRDTIPRPHVRTHQLMLAILAAAERDGRRGVLKELGSATLRCGKYARSREELTPILADPPAAIPLAATAVSLLRAPARSRDLTRATVSSYALTPAAWQHICDGWESPAAPSQRPVTHT
jgi:biotin carboxylase